MGTISGTLLVGINSYTSIFIKKNDELKLKSSILDAFEISYEKSEVINIFNNQIQILNKSNHIFYMASDKSIAFEFRGAGLWGPISGIISLEKDLKTIRKLKITYQEETPGLGGRIAEENYLKQYKNKEIVPEIIVVPEGKANQKNEVNAITGATGSSKALEKLLNNSIKLYLDTLKG